jgi:AcrR family transcriptional regulator
MATVVDVAGDGLRERKKRERRRALHQAAVDLCLEHGYAHVTVEDICQRCDVAPRTFFNYFASKEGAVIGGSDVFGDEVAPAVAEFERGSPSGDLLADFRTLLTSMVQARQKTRDDLKRHVELLRNDPSLLQAQLSRMDQNVRLFRQVIERRLARDSGLAAETPTDGDGESVEHQVFSSRAQVLAGVGVLVLRLTAERIYTDSADGDAAVTVKAIFDEFDQLSAAGNR